jgi:hypothetical protein
MRGRKRSRRLVVLGSAVTFVVLILGASMLIPTAGDNRAIAEPVGPQAANRIAEKNDNAAVTAAAAARARSARTAQIADALQDQRDGANTGQAR